MSEQITISERLYEWMKRSQSPSIQVAMESDFHRQSQMVTYATADDPIVDADPGAGPGE